MTTRRRWTRRAFALAILAGAVIVTIFWVKDRVQWRERQQMLSGLELTCKLYAGDHGGAMPPDLRALFSTYVNSTRYLAYATNEVDYFPGATVKSSPATLLMREKHADHEGRRWLGHVDGSVELEKMHP